MSELEKLLSIASTPFVNARTIARCLARHKSRRHFELQSMLDERNGFQAFECALVVFPTTDTDCALGLDAWNDPSGWRSAYGQDVSAEIVFFAMDLFGGQFGVCGAEVVRFDPESGEITKYATSLVEWAQFLLANYAEDTGWPLAHEWQALNGAISPRQRLLPKQPFILGGDYVIDNMTLIDSQSAMENWGRLYQAVRSVRDGQEVSISGWLELKQALGDSANHSQASAEWRHDRIPRQRPK